MRLMQSSSYLLVGDRKSVFLSYFSPWLILSDFGLLRMWKGVPLAILISRFQLMRFLGRIRLSNRRNELAKQHFIIIVMAQVAEFFNRFYNILLRQHLQDPTIHSEWLYFLSMFKSEQLDQGRIDLYLNILVSENKKKVEFKQKEAIATIGSENRSKIKCNRQQSATISELKFQKKLSENTQNPYSQNFQFKLNAEPLQLRKISSVEQDTHRAQRNSLNVDPKSAKQNQDDPFSGIQLTQTPNLNQYLASLALNHLASQTKQQKEVNQTKWYEKKRKLKEISSRLVREFETNMKLRA